MYMDDIKVFAKKRKRIGDPDSNYKNIQPGCRDRIWQSKIYPAINKKWEKRNNWRNRTAELGKHLDA